MEKTLKTLKNYSMLALSITIFGSLIYIILQLGIEIFNPANSSQDIIGIIIGKSMSTITELILVFTPLLLIILSKKAYTLKGIAFCVFTAYFVLNIIFNFKFGFDLELLIKLLFVIIPALVYLFLFVWKAKKPDNIDNENYIENTTEEIKQQKAKDKVKTMKFLRTYSIVVLSIAIIIGLCFIPSLFGNSDIPVIGIITALFALFLGIIKYIVFITLTIFIPLFIAVITKENYALKSNVFKLVIGLLAIIIITSIIGLILPLCGIYITSIYLLAQFGLALLLSPIPLVIIPPLVYLYLFIKEGKKSGAIDKETELDKQEEEQQEQEEQEEIEAILKNEKWRLKKELDNNK